MLQRLYILLGLFLPMSHVFAIPLGMTIKIPELILFLLIFVGLLLQRPQFERKISWIIFVLFIALIVIPFFSNLYSLTIIDEVKAGAASLGIMSSLGRNSPTLGAWFLLIWNLFSFLIVLSLSKGSSEEIQKFCKALIGVLFISNLYALYHGSLVNLGYAPDLPWPGDKRHFYTGALRTQAFFIEPLNLGHFLIYCLPIFFFQQRWFKSRLAEFIFVKFNFFLSLVVFIFTFSLSAALSIICGYVLSLILTRKIKWRTAIKIIVIGCCALGVIVAVPKTRSVFIEKLVMSIVEPQAVGMTVLDRYYKNESGLNIFKEHPILGAGLNNSGLLYSYYAPPGSYTMEHDEIPFPLNEYIRLLAETGILGLAAFIVFCILYIRLFIQKREHFSIPETLCFLGGFLGTLTDFNFTNLLNVYFIWVFLAFSIALIQERKTKIIP